MTKQADLDRSEAFKKAVQTAKCFFSDQRGRTINEADPKRQRQRTLNAQGILAIRRNPLRLIDEARKDSYAFDALRYGLASLLERGDSIPPEINAWTVKYLRGEIDEPVRKDGRNRNPDKKFRVFSAVEACSETLPIYSATPGNHSCAIEAVCEALVELELQPTSYDRVKRIYLEVSKSKTDNGSFALDF